MASCFRARARKRDVFIAKIDRFVHTFARIEPFANSSETAIDTETER